jgi:hypothetical protein
MTRAPQVRTACQLADNFIGTFQQENAVKAMVTDVQTTLTDRTGFLFDREHAL